MSICNKDCLHCPHPDCINDTMDYEDYQAAARLEREIIRPRTAQQERKAAHKRAYYAAHKEQIQTYQRAYYAAHKEQMRAYQLAYNAANREERLARQKAYSAANRAKLAAHQQIIRNRRLAAGYTQQQLGAIMGVSGATVSRWELGEAPAHWDKLRAVWPDIAPQK